MGTVLDFVRCVLLLAIHSACQETYLKRKLRASSTYYEGAGGMRCCDLKVPASSSPLLSGTEAKKGKGEKIGHPGDYEHEPSCHTASSSAFGR
eukprot:5188116-Amphidinium_carterae.1